MGFPTKNDHFEVFWGYHHLRKHPYHSWVAPLPKQYFLECRFCMDLLPPLQWAAIEFKVSSRKHWSVDKVSHVIEEKNEKILSILFLSKMTALSKLVGGFNPLRKIFVKLDHFPKVRDESSKYLSCHHQKKSSSPQKLNVF